MFGIDLDLRSPMKRLIRLSLLCVIIVCCGCGIVRDMIFEAASDSYTGGGYSHDDRERHYNREISRWEGGPQHYDPITDR